MSTTKTLIHARHVRAILHLVAGHDTSGNPRRGYLVIGPKGYPVAYVDEGYRGPDALRDVIGGYEDYSRMRRVPDGNGDYRYGERRLAYPVSITTKPGELRDWRGKQWS